MKNAEFIFNLLNGEVRFRPDSETEKKVMIEKAINLRAMCDYNVTCSYGDIVLIICMLKDYIKVLDEKRKDDVMYKAYYRNKFDSIANRLARQIYYDYDLAVDRCKSKNDTSSDNDIGGDALELAFRGKK